MVDKCPGGCDDVSELMNETAKIAKRLDHGETVFAEMRAFRASFESFLVEWNAMKPKLEQTAEVVQAWNSIKGFHNTMTAVAAIAKISATIAGCVAGLYLFLKHGLK